MSDQREAKTGTLRDHIIENGVDVLVVNDLQVADLDAIEWSGSQAHLASVEQQLHKPKSVVEYLCVRGPDGSPIAKAGIDFAAAPGAGTIWQVAVHPELQGLGIGAFLLGAAEELIRRRGLNEARIGIEDGNEGALRLYEALGYAPLGRWASSWLDTDESGKEYEYHAEGTDLFKQL